MKTKTTALGCYPNAARENPDPTTKLDRNSAQCNSTARRPPPLSSETLLEIPRTEKSRLRVELVEWDDEQEPVVQFVTLVLGVNGWFPARHRTSLRMDELARVAEVLREVAE